MRSDLRSTLRPYRMLLWAGAALSIACGGGEAETREEAKQTMGSTASTSPFGAVLTPDAGRKILDQCSRSTPSLVTRFWTPSSDVIAEMEAQLPMVLSNLKGQYESLDSTYYRQYVGLVHLNGKRTIFVNAFDRKFIASLNRMRAQVANGNRSSSADTVTWRKDPIVVCDGGERFWGIEYDPEQQSFGQLRVNRVAG